MALMAAGCGRSGTAPPASASPAAPAASAASGTAADEKILNLYIWSDYLAPDTLPEFERQTGIRVRVAYFDTNETLEARMLTGHSGDDVVLPSSTFLQRQIQSGAYQPLDRRQLPNWRNLDPAIMQSVAVNDPGNAHGIVYAWGTYGIGYNEKLVAAALPHQSPTTWHLIFDPAVAARLDSCGINILDEPTGIVRVVLNYLGKDPNDLGADNLAAAEAALLKIRPYVRTINSSNYIEALANGDICVSVGYNGDVVQARNRARQAHNGVIVGYSLPEEGSLQWFDLLAIPADAPHVANALRFLNYLMSPPVMANITNAVGFANANAASLPLVEPSIAADPAVYPTPEQRRRLFVATEDSAETTRALTRVWRKFKTGQ